MGAELERHSLISQVEVTQTARRGTHTNRRGIPPTARTRGPSLSFDACGSPAHWTCRLRAAPHRQKLATARVVHICAQWRHGATRATDLPPTPRRRACGAPAQCARAQAWLLTHPQEGSAPVIWPCTTSGTPTWAHFATKKAFGGPWEAVLARADQMLTVASHGVSVWRSRSHLSTDFPRAL